MCGLDERVSAVTDIEIQNKDEEVREIFDISEDSPIDPLAKKPAPEDMDWSCPVAVGLDHFEGRSWRGFHHHLVLSAIAYLFILTMYLRRKKNFWCDVGTGSARDPAVVGEIERQLPLLRN